jgi:hypothetical protein
MFCATRDSLAWQFAKTKEFFMRDKDVERFAREIVRVFVESGRRADEGMSDSSLVAKCVPDVEILAGVDEAVARGWLLRRGTFLVLTRFGEAAADQPRGSRK